MHPDDASGVLAIGPGLAAIAAGLTGIPDRAGGEVDDLARVVAGERDLRGAGEIEVVGFEAIDLVGVPVDEAGALHDLRQDQSRGDHRDETVLKRERHTGIEQAEFEPCTGAGHEIEARARDPRTTAKRAEAYVASTGIGDHIAIPHARGSLVGYISHPILSLSFLETPIDYGALDGKPVYALFLLISPNVRTHLRVLARLSFCLHAPEFKQAVLEQASRDTILSTLAQTEARLPKGS